MDNPKIEATSKQASIITMASSLLSNNILIVEKASKKPRASEANMEEHGVDMVPKQPYTQILTKGEEETREQCWNALHEVDNQATQDILLDNDIWLTQS